MGLEYVAGQNIFCISIGQNVYFVQNSGTHIGRLTQARSL